MAIDPYGRREGKKHAHKKLNVGRGAIGKEVVAGVKDRATGKVSARYVAELSGRHNLRPLNTTDQMGRIAAGLDGKRLPYAALTA